MNGPWRPGDPVDLAWRGIGYIRVYNRLDMPTLAQVRRALGVIGLASPQVGRWCAGDGGWRPVERPELERWLDQHIQGSDERGITPEHGFTLPPPLGEDQRFSVLVGEDWLIFTADHEFGDGLTVDMFIGHLLRQATSEAELPLPWVVPTGRQRDLAIARAVARSARALPYVLRHRGDLAGGAYEVDPVHRTPTTLVTVSDHQFMGALRDLRRRRYPEATAGALVVAGIRAGVARALGEPRPGFECLFNARDPHLERPWWGNWSIGIYLQPEDDHAPLDITAAMVDARDRGLPAFALASMRVRGGLRRAADPSGGATAAATGVPRLTVSFIAEHGVATVPGIRRGVTAIATFTQPNGPDSVSVHAVEVGGRLVISTAFHPDVWRRDLVDAALRDFLAAPERMLRAPQAVGARW